MAHVGRQEQVRTRRAAIVCAFQCSCRKLLSGHTAYLLLKTCPASHGVAPATITKHGQYQQVLASEVSMSTLS